MPHDDQQRQLCGQSRCTMSLKRQRNDGEGKDSSTTSDSVMLERGAHPYGIQPLGNMWVRSPGTHKKGRFANARTAGLGNCAPMNDVTLQQVRLVYWVAW